MPLGEAITYASITISTPGPTGEFFVWGVVPTVVARWFVLLGARMSSRLPARRAHPGASGGLTAWLFCSSSDSGRYLKEKATEVEGTFRVSGSSKRMKDIQALFDSPPKVRAARRLIPNASLD